MAGVGRFELPTRAFLWRRNPWLFSQIPDSKKAHTFRYEPFLNMAGVERFELPTRAFLWRRNPWLFSQIPDSKKAHTFRYEPSLNMAGVERFELPTRGFGIRCSANWSYTPVVRAIVITSIIKSILLKLKI